MSKTWPLPWEGLSKTRKQGYGRTVCDKGRWEVLSVQRKEPRRGDRCAELRCVSSSGSSYSRKSWLCVAVFTQSVDPRHIYLLSTWETLKTSCLLPELRFPHMNNEEIGLDQFCGQSHRHRARRCWSGFASKYCGVCVLVFSNLTPLESKNLPCMTWILLHLLRLVLWPRIWSF